MPDPLASGVASVTELADMLLLNPPPFGCDGGCSRVVPWTVTLLPPVIGTTIAVELRGRRSAIPEGAGKVVMSVMRKRNLVTFAPVPLMNLRRRESVPKVELLAGSLVKSRTAFGGELSGCPSSINAAPKTLP